MKSNSDKSSQHYFARSHAKVNLTLAVGPVDSNNMHPIVSWMYPVSVHDEILITKLDGSESEFDIRWDLDQTTSIEESSDHLAQVEWALESDLAYRAYRAVENHVDKRLPVSVKILKHIPAGGGLGGGSSDAATVIQGLNTLFDLQLDLQAMHEIALGLGSDIPFFIDESSSVLGPAKVSGFGDRVDRVEPKHDGQIITLFFPEFGCSTGEVYRAFDQQDGLHEDWDHQDASVSRLIHADTLVSDQLFNDLAEPACMVQPGLRELKGLLEHELDQRVHVSGSGSTLFVVGGMKDDVKERVLRFCSTSGVRVTNTALGVFD